MAQWWQNLNGRLVIVRGGGLKSRIPIISLLKHHGDLSIVVLFFPKNCFLHLLHKKFWALFVPCLYFVDNHFLVAFGYPILLQEKVAHGSLVS